jgi:hypothetical protein
VKHDPGNAHSISYASDRMEADPRENMAKRQELTMPKSTSVRSWMHLRLRLPRVSWHPHLEAVHVSNAPRTHQLCYGCPAKPGSVAAQVGAGIPCVGVAEGTWFLPELAIRRVGPRRPHRLLRKSGLRIAG